MCGAIPQLPQYAFVALCWVKAQGKLYILPLLKIVSFYFVKFKVKFSMCSLKHHSIKTYWGSGGIAPRILNLGTRWR
jgi:hypothetical protein